MKWFKWILSPLSILFDLITRARNSLYDLGFLNQFKLKIPIIGVGNITVGGTGKTPHSEYIAKILDSKYKLALLSKGYGRNTNNFNYVEIKSKAVEVGDEALQSKQNLPNQIVGVDHNRVNGVQKILKDFPQTNVFILDDAFQHRSIKIGLNILLTDYNNPIYTDFIMPVGKLRESKRGIKRADCVIVTKCPDNLSEEEAVKIENMLKFKGSVFFSKIKYEDIISMNNKTVATSFTKVSMFIIIWHELLSIIFGYTVVHLLSLMTTTIKCVAVANHEICSKLRLWIPAEDVMAAAGNNDPSVYNNDLSSLSVIAGLITMFDEQIVQNISETFGSTVHTMLLSSFLLIASVVVAILEDRTSLTPETKSGVVTFGIIFGLILFAGKALNGMGQTTSICSQLPRAANRMRLRMVQYLDHNDEDDENLYNFNNFVNITFKRIDALCNGLSANPIGFRLSGFIVTRKITMQVLYSFFTVLFLILAGGGRGGGGGTTSATVVS